jgi:hypothetical protein
MRFSSTQAHWLGGDPAAPRRAYQARASPSSHALRPEWCQKPGRARASLLLNNQNEEEKTMTLRIPSPSDAKRLSKGELSDIFHRVSLALADPDPELREAAKSNVDWIKNSMGP